METYYKSEQAGKPGSNMFTDSAHLVEVCHCSLQVAIHELLVTLGPFMVRSTTLQVCAKVIYYCTRQLIGTFRQHAHEACHCLIVASS
jgi:hypothetical protein